MLRRRNIEPEEVNPPTTASSSAVKKIKEMSPLLRRGRSKGWVIHTEMIFPLMTATCRNIWVLGELIAVLFSFILSMITFSLGKNRVFSILHFVLTIIGGILAITDGVILFKGFCPFTVCKHNRAQVSPETAPEATNNNNFDTPENTKCCKECRDYVRSIFDLIRILLSELFFYPILICDIFEMVTSETYFFDNAVDGISFILFALSLASHLLFVFVVRIAILIAANYHSQKKRIPDGDCEDFDPTISKSAWYFQCYLVFHICAQMVAQVMMFIIIAGAIREENEHLFNTDRQDTGDTTTTVTTSTEVEPSMAMDMDESIHVSNHLWYMLVAGYILPICGILSFFIVTYFWVQEFPIGVCVDVMAGILQKPDIDDLRTISQPNDEELKKRNKVNGFIHLADLKKEFDGFRGTPSYSKFFYAFQSPQTIILSLVYATLQAVFISFAFKILGGNISWIIFCLVAGCIGLVANLYVFSVAFCWIIVFILILLLIALVLIALIVICLGSIAEACDNDD